MRISGLFWQAPAILATLAAAGGCTGTVSERPHPERALLGRNIPSFEAPKDPEPAQAEIVRPTGELILRDALALALMHNPALGALSWEARAREADAIQAGLRPNPEFAAELENVAGTGDLGRFDGAETTLALSQLLELGGKRSNRLRVAQLGHDLASWDYETIRIQVLTHTTKAFIQLLAAQAEVILAEDLIGVAEEVLASVAQRVSAGAVSPAEESRARVELETSRVNRNQAAHALTASRKLLATMWGSTNPVFSKAVGRLEEELEIPPLDELMERVVTNPDLARWNTELAQRRARLALEKSLGRPDVNLTAGVRHVSESDEQALVFGFAVPLPLFDRNQGASQAAAFRLAAAEEERRATALNIREQLSHTYEEFLAAANEARALRDLILPEAVVAFDATEEAYQQGRMRFTDVLDTKRTLFELRLRYYDALARYHTSIADLERLVGDDFSNATETDRRP